MFVVFWLFQFEVEASNIAIVQLMGGQYQVDH